MSEKPFAPGSVLVVVPAHNEEEAIAGTLRSCLSFVHARDVLVINDASRDDTAAIALREGVRCISLPLNLGIGGAVQTGYHIAYREGYQVAVQLDGDGQHDAAELRHLIEPALSGECDMLVGSRYLKREGFQSTGMRRLGSWFLSRLIQLTTGTRVFDPTSGFRAVNRRVLAMFVRYYPSDYPEPESLAILLHAGFRVREAPVRMRDRQGGRSSIRVLDSAIYMVKLISVIAAYGTFSRTISKER